MNNIKIPPGFQDMLSFGLVEALLGRRSRRFFMGAEIPDGVFAYKSKHPPVPLSELERLSVVPWHRSPQPAGGERQSGSARIEIPV